jgi:lambda family phage portal protein
MSLFDFFKRSAEAVAPSAKKRLIPFAPSGRRFYDAAKHDLRTASWPSQPVHIDFILEMQLRTMVARSREQYANNDYVKNYIRILKRNVVGPKGVYLQVKATDTNKKLDTLANTAIEEAWWKWGKLGSCDVTGKLSWLDVEKQFISTIARDGEAVLRFMYGKNASPSGFAVQLIDPQRIPLFLKVEDLGNGNFIRQGIEFNEFGRPIAYYFTTKDTPEKAYWGVGGPDNFLRVPADQIIHRFVTEFTGQKRGIPWGVSALWRMNMIKGFEQAAVTSARVGASKMGFLTREYETPEELADQAAGNNNDGEPEACEDERYILDAEPGTFETLPIGWKAEKWDPAYPNGEFDPFNKAMLRGASAGMGVSYHSLTNDLTDVNFSSIRQGSLDERDEWMSLQEFLIEGLHDVVYGKWLAHHLLARKILVNGNPLPFAKLEKYLNASWQGRRWSWIDPTKDVNAAVSSVDKLLRSPSDVIREQGRDPEEVWTEYARDVESMKNSGLSDDLIMKFISGQVPVPTEPEPKDGSTSEDK